MYKNSDWLLVSNLAIWFELILKLVSNNTLRNLNSIWAHCY